MTLLFPKYGSLDLVGTLLSLRAGVDDPSMRVAPGEVWRASWTPQGPATVHLAERDGEIHVEAWGEGSTWALDQVPGLIGLHDPLDGFDPSADERVGELVAALPGVRLPRSGNLFEALVWAVAAQGVSVFEAQRAHRQLLQAHGTMAPGPVDLLTPPEPRVLAGVPNYELHTYGFEQDRAHTLRRIGAQAHRLYELTTSDVTTIGVELRSIEGLDPGSGELATLLATGHPDAVPTGDQRRTHLVGTALADEPHADDDRMLELLEPWRGHRGRVVRLIETRAVRRSATKLSTPAQP